jgi:tetratricopeptide (TPR) repeat protein
MMNIFKTCFINKRCITGQIFQFNVLVSTVIILLFLLSGIIYGQSKQKVVRLDSITELWLDGNSEKTLALFLAKEKSAKSDVTTLYNIGYLYMLQGDLSKALSYFHRVTQEEEDYVYAYLQMARIRKKVGLIHAANTDLEKGLEEDDDNLDLIVETAKTSMELNQIDRSEKLYIQALDLEDDNVPALVGLAEIYRKKGKYEEARKLLEGNDGVYSEAVILHEKSKLYRALGKETESKKFLTQIMLDYPNSKSWSHIGDTLKIKYKVTKLPKADPLPSYTYKIDPTEELHYKVTYGPMTLGWLKVRILDPEVIGDKEVYPVIFFVDTNPSYGFLLSLHHIYESYIDPVTLNSYKTRLYTPGSERSLVKTYYYDYENNMFEAYGTKEDGRLFYIQKDLPRKVQDSTSMLYFARGLVSDQLDGMTVVVIDEEYKYGHISYLNETESYSVEGKEIQAQKIFARAEFEGIAGMNGDAWGWFTPDEQAVPLKGDISIIVGSISIELDEEKTDIPNYHEED